MEHKPDSYEAVKRIAMQLDSRYWERHRKKTRAEKAKAKSNNSASGSNSGNSGNSGNKSRGSGNSNSHASSSNNKSSNSGKSSTSGSNSTPSHLGKDGKLTPAERKQCMDNKLCMFCGAGGHMAQDCSKFSSFATKEHATTVSVSKKLDSKDSKK